MQLNPVRWFRSGAARRRRGYVNESSGLGTPVDRSATGVFGHSGYTTAQLESVYAESWYGRAIVDYIVDDMFVRWREFDGSGADVFAESERRHRVRDRLARALKASRLYGTGLLVMFTGEGDLSEPLDADALRPGDLLNLYSTAPHTGVGVTSTVADPGDGRFGEPEVYSVSIEGGMHSVHGSRVLRFDHGELPLVESRNRWGVSALVPAMQASVNDAVIASAIGHLSQESSTLTLKLKGLHDRVASHGFDSSEDTSPSVEESVRRYGRAKSIYRVNVIDSEDEIGRTEVRWNQLASVVETVYTRMAAIAEMPATRLMGQSPLGMNATGESDMLNYAMTVAARQSELLTEPLRVLDSVLAADAGLSEAPDYRFVPLTDLTDSERAQTAGLWGSALSSMLASGVMDEDEAREVADETGLFGQLSGPAPEVVDLAEVPIEDVPASAE